MQLALRQKSLYCFDGINSPYVRYSWGYRDAMQDKASNRDRRAIPVGELFCLPTGGPLHEAYRAGYVACMCYSGDNLEANLEVSRESYLGVK